MIYLSYNPNQSINPVKMILNGVDVIFAPLRCPITTIIRMWKQLLYRECTDRNGCSSDYVQEEDAIFTFLQLRGWDG